MRTSSIATTLLLWAGAVFAKQCSYRDEPQILAHTGTPVGTEIVVENSTFYVSETKCKKPKIGVLYLTDAFGIQFVNNKLLADSFARAGYLTVAPDMFNNDPAPFDLATPGFNATEWTLRHNPTAIHPILAKAVAYLRSKNHVTKVAVAGYCFGGRYSFRMLAAGLGVDVGFSAHPSLLEDGEILAVQGPISLAAAEIDAMMPPARKSAIEAMLASQVAQPYQVSLYGGTAHGFAVRANISDPEQKFGKEAAFYQAVRWFDAWAGGAL
ncbi:dienelactone hydrolase family-domain-containing protein [Apodospora peruviana]|uniref:Dienelactone hydrolase family-domain-containing protein n=1 Tax=Apodospora peruviana TaxID=516989 RepID=A0AAE0M083_9PEZI|nr:dienelactone hydrolase family-domain-containing protein [Apodospora peruviana]